MDTFAARCGRNAALIYDKRRGENQFPSVADVCRLTCTLYSRLMPPVAGVLANEAVAINFFHRSGEETCSVLSCLYNPRKVRNSPMIRGYISERIQSKCGTYSERFMERGGNYWPKCICK